MLRNNPNPERDAEFRQEAVLRYHQLLSFLQEKEDSLWAYLERITVDNKEGPLFRDGPYPGNLLSQKLVFGIILVGTLIFSLSAKTVRSTVPFSSRLISEVIRNLTYA